MNLDKQETLLREFEEHMTSPWFPCFAGQTAQQRGHITHLFAGAMGCPADDAKVAAGVAAFANREKPEHVFESLVVHYTDSMTMSEQLFERLLFARLQGIHDADARHHEWDPSVSTDPQDPPSA